MIAVIGLLLFLFQSTLPGWGATDNAADGVPQVDISIHAPRMGSDRSLRAVSHPDRSISIHAPRMGSDALLFGSPSQPV